MIIGIDLGTTNSVAAIMTDDGPKLIPNALGEALTPSVVGIDHNGELLVGRAAKELQVVAPQRCAALFKRHMGSDHKTKLVDREFTPEQLSSLVLRALKEDAEAHLGKPVTEAVVTVPAYFNDFQRKATIQAGKLAGLKVERIINEPTAAAIAYGLHEAEEDRVLVVFDLGGGTFDVSIVELFAGTVEVRASSGECFLGGEDFTRTMAARLLERHGYVFERAELDHPALVSRMIQQCERAKCQLSRQESAEVVIANQQGDLAEGAPRETITRADLHQWTDHILARIELPMRRGLGDAGLKRDEVDEVILVGGATRMPTVVRRVAEYFGREPHHRLNPDEVVALGAAIQAGLMSRHASVEDLVVTDVAPFTLGVEMSKQLGLERRDGYFLPIITRNTTIPVSRMERVCTIDPNQSCISVRIFQGESRRTDDNTLLGQFDVSDIPRGPAGQEVDIRFTYDLNGVLEVEATIVATQRKVRTVITQHARGLSEKELALAVEKMQSMKTHPRDETVNRFLLRRAERIYRELPQWHRELLAQLLDGFEGSLSLQDPSAIVEHREQLQQFLDSYEQDFENRVDDDDDSPFGT